MTTERPSLSREFVIKSKRSKKTIPGYSSGNRRVPFLFMEVYGKDNQFEK